LDDEDNPPCVEVDGVSDELPSMVREERKKIVEGERMASTVIPVNLVVPARQRVLTDQQVRDILATSGAVGVTDCSCRSIGGDCGSPLDVCLVIDMTEDDIRRSDDTRLITIEEAMDVLERTSEMGLVHLTLWDGDGRPFAICSCCPCCCHDLLAMSVFGYSDQVVRSDYVARHDPEECTSCGTCVTRCHFGAFTDAGDGVAFDQGRCFGCGQCALVCPGDAIELVVRE
jgi:ferredoxin